MAVFNRYQRIRLKVATILIVGLFMTLAILMNTKQPTVLNTQPQTASCSMSLSEKIGSADLIMTGHVSMVVPGGQLGAQVIVEPTHIYRGTFTGSTLTIQAFAASSATNNQSNDAELHFTSSQDPYLFYLHHQADGTYRTAKCDGTRLFGSGLTPEEQHLLEPVGAT